MIKDILCDLKMPRMGQGAALAKWYANEWQENDWKRIRSAVDLGFNLIDTAEAYPGSEEMVGKAISDIREDVIVATKFSPQHSNYSSVIEAAERSLKNLNTDYIDIYQMHWPNPGVPFLETLQAMEKLLQDGKVRYLGFSNFCSPDLDCVPSLASLQFEYNLFDRSVENDVLSFCQNRQIYFLAYTPLDRGNIVDGYVRKYALKQVACKYNKSMGQIALAWLLSHDNVIPVPRMVSEKHLVDNAIAAKMKLDYDDIDKINRVCHMDLINILPQDICILEDEQINKKIYTTIDDARNNWLDYQPSPAIMAEGLKEGDRFKPIRVKHKISDLWMQNGKVYCFYLVEGSSRFWAHRLAFGDDVPISSLVRRIG